MLNIAVCGANGKMGQEVVKAVNSSDDMKLVAQIDIFNGQFKTIEEAKKATNIDILIDRLVIKPEIRNRLAESVEIALKHANNLFALYLALRRSARY